MGYLKPQDRITIQFPKTGYTDMWIFSVDKSKQEVTVATDLRQRSVKLPYCTFMVTTHQLLFSLDSTASENLWTVKWSAVLVNDLLRSYIPEITGSSKDGLKVQQRTETNVIPTPPSSNSPDVQISDSPSSSSQSVIKLISSQPDETNFEQDSSITPPTKIQSAEGSTFSLASVPGLLEVVVDYLFEDSSWEKTLSDLILG
jgi:hypothetical protein